MLSVERRMHRIVLECAALAALAFAAGCGIGRAVEIDSIAELDTIRERGAARGWVLASCRVAVEPGEELGDSEWPLAVDQGEAERDLAEILARTGIFARVDCSGTSADAEGVELAAGKEGVVSAPDGLLHPVHLTISVVGARGRFAGWNFWVVPNLAFWLIVSPLAAGAVGDEEYAAELKIRASLAEAGTEDPLWAGEFSASMEAPLDHFQRGFSLWDLFPPGPLFAPPDPGKVSSVLVPHLLRKLGVDLAQRLALDLRRPDTDLMVCVDAVRAAPAGGPRPGEAGPGPEGKPAARRPSSSDAEALAAAFLARPCRKEIIRLSPDAGEEALVSVLESVARRKHTQVRDFLLFYAGPGTLVPVAGKPGEKKWEAAILFPGPGRRPLPVSELLRLVQSVPAESPMVVLDTGFSGAGGRAVAPPAGAPAATEEIVPLPATKPPVCFLAACRPDEAGFESGSDRRGALSLVLNLLLSPKGDRNKDGKITATEVIGRISWSLNRRVRTAGGRPLHPQLSGDGVLWRGAAPLPRKPEKNAKEGAGPGPEGKAGATEKTQQ
jgi:hypothetical protein